MFLCPMHVSCQQSMENPRTMNIKFVEHQTSHEKKEMSRQLKKTTLTVAIGLIAIEIAKLLTDEQSLTTEKHQKLVKIWYY